MRITKNLFPRLGIAAAGAALLGACSGTGDATRSLTPGARSSDFVATLPPTTIAIAPSNGPTAGGNTVTLIGSQFDASTRVTVGSQSVPNPTVISSTQVTFPMVAGEGLSVPVVLSTNMGAAPARTYSYDPPVVINVTPAAGPSSGGAQVTLSGNNFGVNPVVLFGTNSGTLVSHTHTQIVATAPAGTPGQTVQVRVSAGNQLSPAASYSYSAPTITSILPDHAPTNGGTPITLTGSSFGSSTPTVTFNGASATVVSASQSQIIVTAPKGEGRNVQVAVTADGSVSNTAAFNYDPPRVNYIGPVSGPTSGGTTVLLSGSSLSPSATVTVGGVAAVIQSASYSGISFTAPPGNPGPAPVIVTVAGQSSNADVTYNYVASKPAIANVSPASGPTAGGTTVTLSGSSFGTSPSVTVGSAVAELQSANNTQITFRLPAGEGIVPIVVTASGLSSDPASFAYGAPTIGSIVANSGPSAGGYPVTLTGSNFGLNPSVSVDGANATLGGHSHSQIVFTAPAGSPGHDAQVRVTVAGQVSNSATFHYNAPSLVNITPSHGATSGGTTITLTGSSFGTAPTVLFNGSLVAPISASQSQIVFASTAGQGSASVVVSAGSSVSNALTFNYDAPSIASLSPTSGPVAGGTSVTISGANFGLSPIAMFGGTMAPLVSSSHTRLVVTAPAGAPASVPVSVTVGGKASNAVSYQYVCPDGTVISNGACVTPVAALGNVVNALPAEAQAQLAPLVADVTSKLTDNNPSNDNGACGQLNALSKQTAALLKTGKISASDAAAVNGAITLVSGKAGCK